jgi:hypothetical protein
MFYEVLMEKRAEREEEKRANLLAEAEKRLAANRSRLEMLKKTQKPKGGGLLSILKSPFKAARDSRNPWR